MSFELAAAMPLTCGHCAAAAEFAAQYHLRALLCVRRAQLLRLYFSVQRAYGQVKQSARARRRERVLNLLHALSWRNAGGSKIQPLQPPQPSPTTNQFTRQIKIQRHKSSMLSVFRDSSLSYKHLQFCIGMFLLEKLQDYENIARKYGRANMMPQHLTTTRQSNIVQVHAGTRI